MPRLSPNAFAMAPADGDAGIFHRMVIIDMQVTLNLDIHVDQRMAAQLVQHMIENPTPVEIVDLPVPSISTRTETEVSLVLRMISPLRSAICGRSVKMSPFLISTRHKYPVVPSSCMICAKQCSAGRICNREKQTYIDAEKGRMPAR